MSSDGPVHFTGETPSRFQVATGLPSESRAAISAVCRLTSILIFAIQLATFFVSWLMGRVSLMFWYLARPGIRWTKAFSPPSLYSKTSYSTDRPSHFDQFPRSPSPSILTRNRRLWAVGTSAIVSSSAQIGQEAGALPIDQQFSLQAAAEPVVEPSREFIHLGLGRLMRPRRRRAALPSGCPGSDSADGHGSLVPRPLQNLAPPLRRRVGEGGVVARRLDRDTA